jgi:hypothetical protein
VNLILKVRYIIVISCGLFVMGGSACAHRQEVKIPQISEWEEMGIVLPKGSPGTWDARLTGMINPCAVIKKSGTYFLYYLGARGDRTTDGGPAFRALGVATSSDGIHYRKYDGNPILKHLPHNNQEEGIFSAASSLDENGHIALHYGALWASNPTTESVQSYIALATSIDGLNFTDRGYIVRWNDDSVWGYGDELFPVGSYWADGKWYVYYIAKGAKEPKWSLGLATGPSADNLPNSEGAVRQHNFFYSGGNPVLIGADKIALYIEAYDPRHKIEIRTASLSAPAKLSSPIERYDFASPLKGQTVFLDAESGKWLMYYLAGDGENIRLKTAPAVYIADRSNSKK